MALNWLLACGILLRLAVFFTAGPFNPDQHYEVIQYIAEHHALPVSNQLSQSYHPPLYYLLMAPLYAMWPDPKLLQFASFLLSSANLILIRWLLRDRGLIPQPTARLVAFALACFLPEFVMFGNFVSNDTLTMLVGTLLFAGLARYVAGPSTGRMITVAALVGVGLLTKGTFLLVGPALALIVLLVESRRHNLSRALAATALFCLTFAAIGCYKYVENVVHLGRPFVNNQDTDSVYTQMQRGTWKGPATIYDIDVTKLIRRPILQVHNTFSYPLLMYGTFWYSHIPDSSFRANIGGYAWVGSLIYSVAIVPTLIFLIGVGRAAIVLTQFLRSKAETRLADHRSTLVVGSLLMLVANLAIVIAAGVKYDVWACFQSRLCFQSMFPAMMLFGYGADVLPARAGARSRALRGAIWMICWATVGCCLLYFAVEIAFARGLLPAGAEVTP